MKLAILMATGMVMGLLSGCASYDTGCCGSATPGAYVTTYTTTTYPSCGYCSTTYNLVDY